MFFFFVQFNMHSTTPAEKKVVIDVSFVFGAPKPGSIISVMDLTHSSDAAIGTNKVVQFCSKKTM